MPSAVLYCRVSTKDQVQNYSLSMQEKECRAYCEKHGVEVLEAFVEEGESAKTTDRPEFQKMLRYCQTHKKHVAWLVVYSFNRFARSTEDHLTTKAMLLRWGINLRSVTEPSDDSPMGRACEGFIAIMSQLDNDLKAERTICRNARGRQPRQISAQAAARLSKCASNGKGTQYRSCI